MLYRRSAIGTALTDSLDELIQSGLMDPQVAMKILSQFDSSIAEALKTKVRTKGTFKGHLDIYRFCEEVWTLVVERAPFRMDNENFSADKIKIVACSVKQPAGGNA